MGAWVGLILAGMGLLGWLGLGVVGLVAGGRMLVGRLGLGGFASPGRGVGGCHAGSSPSQ